MDLPPWGPPIGTQYGHHHSKIPSIVVYFEPSVIWAENINPGAIEEVKSQNWPFFVFFQKMTPPGQTKNSQNGRFPDLCIKPL